MNHRSVCITGYGVLSPLGRDLEAFDDALFGGDSAVCVEELVLPGMAPCRVPLARCDFDESQVQAPSKVALDRGSAMALAAAAAATRQAAWAVGDADPERVGIYWGSGMGGGASFDDNCHTVYAEQRRLRPTSVVTTMPNAALAELALRYAARGAAIGYACACASAAVAIGEALHALRAGRLDLAIVGGSEAPLAISIMGAWHAMRVLAPVGDAGNEPSRAVCRPFAADRAGFALGEGAAALVLESEAHARARRVGWDVQLSGYASTCDGLYITQPDPAGQVRAMQAALRDAGLTPGEIGHVNAHGTAPAPVMRPRPSRWGGSSVASRRRSLPQRRRWATCWAPAAPWNWWRHCARCSGAWRRRRRTRPRWTPASRSTLCAARRENCRG